MSKSDAENKWNHIYAAKDLSDPPQASSVLHDHAFLLPKFGVALDLACGLAGNAIYLDECGLTVHAWDISAAAIEKVNQYCLDNDISIITEVRDVEKTPLIENSFDVICISYYLERALVRDIISALKPNGLLFYQTFITEKVSEAGPNNPKYYLQENELIRLFSPLHILAYKEYGKVGDVNKGLRDVATLVAQKRVNRQDK
ncbi:MAG: class I SAM-dependent methyltransferase [Gammaproteobacteria bacterium]